MRRPRRPLTPAHRGHRRRRPRPHREHFDLARVQRMVEIVNPILAAQRKPTKADLMPSELVTNEFIDPAISLSP